jgi:hypothetical protein
MSDAIQKQVACSRNWPARMPAERWRLYRDVMASAREHSIGFAIGGGLAITAYTGQWRDTKDIDLYVCPRDRQALIQIATDAGLHDYYEREPYDRNWIHRSYGFDTIVDVMWAMANQRAVVDDDWLSGPSTIIDGLEVQFLPAEYLLWSKLYVLQRDRCDWPDAMNILYTVGSDFDWRRLLAQLEQDSGLLGGLLAAYRWLYPAKANALPPWLWRELGLSDSQERDTDADPKRRAALLDSRPWFVPTLDDTKRICAQLTENGKC